MDDLFALSQRILSSNTVKPDDREQLRLLVRERATGDFFFFAKHVVGFPDLSDRLHAEMCEVVAGPEQFKLLEVPRAHLKTSICSIAYPLWDVTKDPCTRILLRSATEANAANWVLLMEHILLSNPIFRWLYPELIPQDFQRVRWNSTQMEVRRPESFPEATVEAFGAGGTAVSRHYRLIIEDDMINEDHLLSATQMNKQIDEHKRSLSLLVDPSKDRRLNVSNRWAFDDLNSWIREHEPWVRDYRRSALEPAPAGDPCHHDALWPGLKPIWEERFTKKVLEQILETQGPHIFSCMYMNDPVHDNARAFDPETFRYFETRPTVPLRVYIAIDPAISLSKGADYTALVTVGVDPDRNIYVLDAQHDRWTTDEWIDRLFALLRTYPTATVGIEMTAFQKVLQFPIREAMRRHNLTFPIVPLKHGGAGKFSELRIGGLQEYFQNGSIFLKRSQTALLDQLKRVGGRLAHDDLADALAYAVLYLARPASVAEHTDTNPLLLENILLDLKQKKRGPESIWTWHKSGGARVA